jgi:hypothetical protein
VAADFFGLCGEARAKWKHFALIRFCVAAITMRTWLLTPARRSRAGVSLPMAFPELPDIAQTARDYLSWRA